MSILVIIASHCNDIKRTAQLQKTTAQLARHGIPVIVSLSQEQNVMHDVKLHQHVTTTVFQQPIQLSQFQHLMCATYSACFAKHNPQWILCVDDDDAIDVQGAIHEIERLAKRYSSSSAVCLQGCGTTAHRHSRQEVRTDWCGTVCSRFVWSTIFDTSLCEQFALALSYGMLDVRVLDSLCRSCVIVSPARPFMTYEPVQTTKSWQYCNFQALPPSGCRSNGLVEEVSVSAHACNFDALERDFVNPYVEAIQNKLSCHRSCLPIMTTIPPTLKATYDKAYSGLRSTNEILPAELLDHKELKADSLRVFRENKALRDEFIQGDHTTSQISRTRGPSLVLQPGKQRSAILAMKEIIKERQFVNISENGLLDYIKMFEAVAARANAATKEINILIKQKSKLEKKIQELEDAAVATETEPEETGEDETAD